MTRPVAILTDERMLDHENGPGHPECPDRLRAILRELERMPPEMLLRREPRPATREQLELVHTPQHVDAIDSLRGRRGRLDADTGVSPGSVDAAHVAAGAAIDAVDGLLDGSWTRAFALVRPPGHHAEPDRAMGFCLFDNIAIAAAHAVEQPGVDRVLIVDWDVHHGNGTQRAFYGRDDVLFFGSHRHPFYPGSGAWDEIGEGAGRGHTVNIPLPFGVGDGEVVEIYEELLPEIAESYRPDLVLVSAGFDAHGDDPLGGLTMTDDGFGALSGLVVQVADRHAQGRLALVLEGGYDLAALARCVRVCIEVMSGSDPPGVLPGAPGFAGRAVERARRARPRPGRDRERSA